MCPMGWRRLGIDRYQALTALASLFAAGLAAFVPAVVSRDGVQKVLFALCLVGLVLVISLVRTGPSGRAIIVNLQEAHWREPWPEIAREFATQRFRWHFFFAQTLPPSPTAWGSAIASTDSLIDAALDNSPGLGTDAREVSVLIAAPLPVAWMLGRRLQFLNVSAYQRHTGADKGFFLASVVNRDLRLKPDGGSEQAVVEIERVPVTRDRGGPTALIIGLGLHDIASEAIDHARGLGATEAIVVRGTHGGKIDENEESFRAELVDTYRAVQGELDFRRDTLVYLSCPVAIAFSLGILFGVDLRGRFFHHMPEGYVEVEEPTPR